MSPRDAAFALAAQRGIERVNLAERLCVIAGLPRAASTFLHFTFQRHPDVFVTARKEIDFFSLNYARGEAWYEELYRGSGEVARCFDVSPNYSLHPEAHHRIAKFSSLAPVVLVVREPASWAESFFEMTRLILHGTESLPAMLREGYVHRRDGEELQIRFYPGMFREVVERYQQTFGDRLLLCDFRLMKDDPLALLQAIEQHVGISPFFDQGNFENVRINRSGQQSMLVKGLNYLAMQQGVIRLVEATLPRPAIVKLKNFKERLAAREDRRAGEGAVSEAERDEVRAFFAEDIAYVKTLFGAAPLLIGGQPAPYDVSKGQHA